MGKKNPTKFFTELYLKYYTFQIMILLKRKKNKQKCLALEVVINNISICYAFIC